MNKIIKSFFVIFISLVIFNLKLNAEVVKEVEIQGNERVSSETIILYGDISKGKDYNSSDINDLIKKLYATSFFSNIVVNLKNGKLIKILLQESITTGYHSISWNASGQPSGLYLIKISSEEFSDYKKIMLLK